MTPAPPPPARARVLELDVLRGLSILLVLVVHTPVHPEVHSWLYFPLTAMNRVGWTGVDVFFVLSGYLVGGLLIQEYQRTGTIAPLRFWTRRAFKVWPTLYAFLAAMLIVDATFLEHGPAAGRVLAAWVKYWPNWFHLQSYVEGHLDWLWTLAIEEHFYFVLPLVLLGLLGATAGAPARPPSDIFRRVTMCLGAIVVACTALRWLSYLWGAHELIEATHLRVDALFFGVFLSCLVRAHGGAVRKLLPLRHVLLVVSLLAWVPFYLDRTGQPQLALYPFGFVLLYVGAGGLVLSAYLASTVPAASRGVLRRVAAWPMAWLAWLGVRSYAIYVWQGFFAQPLARRACDWLRVRGDRPGFEGWAHDLVYLATYVVLGTVMFHVIELPGLRVRQRLFPPVVNPRLGAA